MQIVEIILPKSGVAFLTEFVYVDFLQRKPLSLKVDDVNICRKIHESSCGYASETATSQLHLTSITSDAERGRQERCLTRWQTHND